MPLRLSLVSKFLNYPSLIQKGLVRNQFSSLEADKQWDLFAGVCLQRPPIIVPELNWLDKRMNDLLQKVEIADSLYSDHEMRHFEDVRRSERISSGINVEEKDLEEAAKQTAQDFEEASINELKTFETGASITKADLTNNQKSIDRSLEKYLYFTVKTQIGDQYHWMFPQQLHQPSLSSSLRQTAESALFNCLPIDQNTKKPLVRIRFFGNSPASFYQYRYPKSVQQEQTRYGARIFLFKCFLDLEQESPIENHTGIEGSFGERNVKLLSNYSDYLWLTRTELETQMPKQYWNQLVSNTLYPDELVNIEQLTREKKRKLSRLTSRLKKIESLKNNSLGASSP